MAKKTVNVFIGAKNKMQAGLRSSLKSLKRFNRSAKATLRSLGQMFRRVGLVAGTAFVGLVKFGNQFRTQMAQVNTMLGDGSTLIPKLTKQVRDLSAEFGVAKKTLTEGLYQALSAGIPSGNAIEFLRVATEAAVGGLTDVKTSVDGLTTVMNAYGIAADKARSVSDILFTVVKDGKINYEELSENIGKIAPFAKVAEVGIRDLGAMIATLVKVEKPERAMTALRQSMIFAAKNGKTLLQVLDEFEGKNLQQILAAGVNAKAAAGIALMSANIGVLRKEMVKFQNTAGAADEAFKKVDAMRHWQKIWQSILSVTTRVGEMLDQTLSPAINSLAKKIRNFGKSEQFDKFIANVKEATQDVVNLISVLSGGGDDARKALKGIGNVFIAIFAVAGEKIANILKTAAPIIGKLIAKGMVSFAADAGKKAGVRTAAREAVTRKMGPDLSKTVPGQVGRKTSFTKEFERRVDEMVIRMTALNAAAKERGISTKGLTAAEINLKDKLNALTDSVKDAKIPSSNVGEKDKEETAFDKVLKRDEAITLANSKAFERVGGGNIFGLDKPEKKPLTNFEAMVGKEIAAALALGPMETAKETSMLSIGELFTLMQTGNAKATELSELQKQTVTLDKILVKIDGGPE